MSIHFASVAEACSIKYRILHIYSSLIFWLLKMKWWNVLTNLNNCIVLKCWFYSAVWFFIYSKLIYHVDFFCDELLVWGFKMEFKNV